MKKRNQIIAFAMAAVLAASMLACGKNEKSAIEPKNDVVAESVAKTDEAQKTESQETASGKICEGAKFVIGIEQNSLVTDYENSYIARKLEEDLGVELEWYILPAAGEDVLTKLGLMAAGEDEMPDIIIVDNVIKTDMIYTYGTQGVFAPLTEYVNDPEVMPYFNAIPEEDKKIIMTGITSSDGNVYGLPNYQPSGWNLTPCRFFINRVWLDRLGLEVPTTTDELYDVLTHFVNDDPNQNGKKDEIGLYGYCGGYGQNSTWGIMNSFQFFNQFKQNGGLALSDDSSTVIAPFAEDGFREGIEYLAKLVNDGLMPASVFTDDDAQYKATLNAETPIVGCVTVGSYTGNYPDYENNANFQEMEIMTPVKGTVNYTPTTEITPSITTFIASSCSDVKMAARLCDYFYSEEMSNTVRYGEEGRDWTADPSVTSQYTNAAVQNGTIPGIDIVYHMDASRDTWNEANDVIWHNVGPRYSSLEHEMANADAQVQYDPNSKSIYIGAFNDAYYMPLRPKNLLPVLQYTAEEAELITLPMADIKTEVQSAYAAFITGQTELTDKTWNEYLERLESFGLSEWLKCAQDAYDRVK